MLILRPRPLVSSSALARISPARPSPPSPPRLPAALPDPAAALGVRRGVSGGWGMAAGGHGMLTLRPRPLVSSSALACIPPARSSPPSPPRLPAALPGPAAALGVRRGVSGGYEKHGHAGLQPRMGRDVTARCAVGRRAPHIQLAFAAHIALAHAVPSPWRNRVCAQRRSERGAVHVGPWCRVGSMRMQGMGALDTCKSVTQSAMETRGGRAGGSHSRASWRGHVALLCVRGGGGWWVPWRVCVCGQPCVSREFCVYPSY